MVPPVSVSWLRFCRLPAMSASVAAPDLSLNAGVDLLGWILYSECERAYRSK